MQSNMSYDEYVAQCEPGDDTSEAGWLAAMDYLSFEEEQDDAND